MLDDIYWIMGFDNNEDWNCILIVGIGEGT